MQEENLESYQIKCQENFSVSKFKNNGNVLFFEYVKISLEALRFKKIFKKKLKTCPIRHNLSARFSA